MLIFDKLKKGGIRLVLASQSPRRKQLMEEAQLPFEVVSYDVDESYPADTPSLSVPVYLSQLKSNHYPHELSQCDILITADTVVICDGKILGKPRNVQGAKAMLASISDKRHMVVTGVTLRSKAKSVSFSCQSVVHFAPLTAEEIDYYVEKYQPLDKAGSYGIQEWIGYIGIKGIEGSFFNVMGLPIQRLYKELNKFIG